MGGARGARRAASWGGVLLVVMPAVLCCAAASPLVERDGGFVNERHGYRIGRPPASDPAWDRKRVEGSLLAYRRPVILAPRTEDDPRPASEARMTFSSRCGEPLASPEFLARHLRIGIPAYVVRESGAIDLGGVAGWKQVFDAKAQGGAVRVKTVTFAANGCALDWVLVAPDAGAFEQAEPEFDAWWHTLVVESSGVPGPELAR